MFLGSELHALVCRFPRLRVLQDVITSHGAIVVICLKAIYPHFLAGGSIKSYHNQIQEDNGIVIVHMVPEFRDVSNM